MNRTLREDVVILAPRGRDAPLAASILSEARFEPRIASDIGELVGMLRSGAGFAIVTEEALKATDLRGIAAFIADQEEWSDFPFILLTERGGGFERNPSAQRYLDLLGNVTFLERPFHPTTLVSLSSSALRARRRQYDARARLERIHEAEQRLSVALAAGRLGTWTVHYPDLKLEASDLCKAHFGRKPWQDFSREDLLASIHPDDRAAVEDKIEAAMATAEDYDVEFRCFQPNGAMRWLQVRGRPTLDSNGKPLRRTGVSQDITERREGEEVLRDLAAELEERVEQRTREREAVAAQLHEAQKLETLGQLTGGVAHDFNNLLTPILGGLDMLRRIHGDQRSQRLIDGALQASERARTLVSRLLAFARRQNLEARPVDMLALVEGMLDLMKRSLGPRIEVRLNTPAQVPAAMVDPNQLELALLNLAVNARDAMDGEGILTIGLQCQQLSSDNGFGIGAGNYVCLDIADTGTGMDEDTLKRAIEPFYSTKGIGKGTGLGLSMVHGLAAQSGGALHLASAVGKGTTASLWLPVANTPAAKMVTTTEEPIKVDYSLNVLLADDEELVRVGTADMLTDLGHRVVHVSSGALALAKLRNEAFDLLVTDFLMPGMSGMELAREARDLHPQLPVLLITGFADLAGSTTIDVSRLAKPFRHNDLARAIAEIVQPSVALEIQPG